MIPNGIDPEPFDRAAPCRARTLGVPRNAQLALAVGRLDDQKGIPDLLAAAEQVIAGRSRPGIWRWRATVHDGPGCWIRLPPGPRSEAASTG